MRNLFEDVVKLLAAEGLLSLEDIYINGTKIEANLPDRCQPLQFLGCETDLWQHKAIKQKHMVKCFMLGGKEKTTCIMEALNNR